MTREVYAVRWRRDAARWVCPQLGESATHKLSFVREIARRLRRRWEYAHVPCQLRVYGRSGRVQFERTYGRDPRRFPG